MRHELKTHPEWFGDVASGRKTFEVRVDDRGFEEGDVLRLREFEPDSGYTGREVEKVITYRLNLKLLWPDVEPKGLMALGLGDPLEEALRESVTSASTLHIRSGANPPEHDADHCREATIPEVEDWLREQDLEGRDVSRV